MNQNSTQNNSNLQQTVRFFEIILRASVDGIVIIDPAKNIIFVNDTFCKFFSSNRQDVIETNLFTCLTKLDSDARDIWNGLENQIKEHGIARDVGFTMKTGEGMRYFLVNASIIEKIDNVEAGLIISIWRDDTQSRTAIELNKEINERRLEMETLKESEGKYHRLFEYSNDIVLYVDKFGKVLDVNHRVKEILGFTPEEVIGKYFFNLGVLGIKDLPKIVEMFKNTVRKGMARDKEGRFLDKVEMELRAKNGNPIHVETSTTIVKKDGKTEGFLTNIRDITERRKADEKLRASELLLNKSQEIAHLGYWMLDISTNQLIWSDEVYRIFGFQPAEFNPSYAAFLDMTHPEDRAMVDEAYSGSLREGRDIYDIEHRIVRKHTGEIRHVHERCEHKKDASGTIIRSVGMVQDITERKQAQEELKKLNTELEQRVKERTAELMQKNDDLEKFNKLFVGRELRMAELKKIIIELETKISELEKENRRLNAKWISDLSGASKAL